MARHVKVLRVKAHRALLNQDHALVNQDPTLAQNDAMMTSTAHKWHHVHCTQRALSMMDVILVCAVEGLWQRQLSAARALACSEYG